jgi:hypothetical protein
LKSRFAGSGYVHRISASAKPRGQSFHSMS